ncbi:MAG: hypothetical protein ACTHU0_19945 [Kofleriaceae bacterium]
MSSLDEDDIARAFMSWTLHQSDTLIFLDPVDRAAARELARHQAWIALWTWVGRHYVIGWVLHQASNGTDRPCGQDYGAVDPEVRDECRAWLERHT